jgi:hypothetical protein
MPQVKPAPRRDEFDDILDESNKMLEDDELNASDWAIANKTVENIGLTRELQSEELQRHLKKCSKDAWARYNRSAVKLISTLVEFKQRR